MFYKGFIVVKSLLGEKVIWWSKKSLWIRVTKTAIFQHASFMQIRQERCAQDNKNNILFKQNLFRFIPYWWVTIRCFTF